MSTALPVPSKMIMAPKSSIPELVTNAVKELPFPLELPVGFEWVFFFYI